MTTSGIFRENKLLRMTVFEIFRDQTFAILRKRESFFL